MSGTDTFIFKGWEANAKTIVHKNVNTCTCTCIDITSCTTNQQKT